MKDGLKLLAPIVVVGGTWTLVGNAWVAILAYHALIVVVAPPRRVPRGWSAGVFTAMAVPTALAGPVAYALLPHMVRSAVGVWLSSHGLSGAALAAMVPYFGVVHPVLEQSYWAPLRHAGARAHIAFAAYHAAVLWALLDPVWLAAVLLVLFAASVAWRRVAECTGGVLVPVCTHVLADLGIVLAAVLRA